MPYNQHGIWEDDDYASSGQMPGSSGTNASSGVTPVQSAPAAPAFGNQSWQDFMSKNPSVASQAPADYWIPPNASFGDDPSGRINQQNPFADPNKKFVQDGLTGGFIDGIGITIGEGRSTTPAQAQAALNAMVAEFGPELTYDWLRRNPGDFTRGPEALRSERTGDGARGGSGGGSGGGGGLSSPQFGSGGQNLIENYALDRFGQLTNPDANSGTALFEKYARELIDTLRGPVYSASDEAVIKGGAFDSIEQDRAATRQRWLEEVGRRGFQPSSGVALAGIQRIEDQFNQYRTTVEAEFARKAIDQTRQQRLQVLNTAGQLAGSEEGRLDKAGTYAFMPYGLEQDAFNRNLALVGAGGSPQSTLSSALALLTANMQSNAYNSQQRSQLTNGFLEYLGMLYG